MIYRHIEKLVKFWNLLGRCYSFYLSNFTLNRYFLSDLICYISCVTCKNLTSQLQLAELIPVRCKHLFKNKFIVLTFLQITFITFYYRICILLQSQDLWLVIHFKLVVLGFCIIHQLCFLTHIHLLLLIIIKLLLFKLLVCFFQLKCNSLALLLEKVYLLGGVFETLN